MSDERLRELFHGEPTASEREAEERAWPVVRSAYERHAGGHAGHPRRTVALSLAGAAAVVALALSPAGADVREWIADAVEPGVERAAPALTKLPTGGRLLVESPEGAWLVGDDGSQRRLGDYGDLAASPGGAFVAATAGHQLAAIVADSAQPLADGQTPGTVRWAENAPHRVADPAWSPSGYRVAYREGRSLRVIDGDGTGDRVLARVAGVAPPAWRPLAEPLAPGATGVGTHDLAYVDAAGAVVVRDTDSKKVLRREYAPRTLQLLWAGDGSSLIALGSGTIEVIGLGKAPDALLEADGATRFRRAAPLGSGARFAIQTIVRKPSGDPLSIVNTWSLADPSGPRERLFAGPGRISDLTTSPDGRWLLLGWRTADQWLFLRPGGERQRAVDNIASQFDPGGSGRGVPRVAGWCCG